MPRLKRTGEIIIINFSINIVSLYVYIKYIWICSSLLGISGQPNVLVFSVYKVFDRCLLYTIRYAFRH